MCNACWDRHSINDDPMLLFDSSKTMCWNLLCYQYHPPQTHGQRNWARVYAKEKNSRWRKWSDEKICNLIRVGNKMQRKISTNNYFFLGQNDSHSLVLLWKIGLKARARALVLSHQKTGGIGRKMPRSLRIWWIHASSATPVARDQYLDSVDDRETVYCFFKSHVIGLWPKEDNKHCSGMTMIARIISPGQHRWK